MKTSYGDFDIPIQDPVLASHDQETIEDKVEEFNAKRSKEDLRDEIEYRKGWVKLI